MKRSNAAETTVRLSIEHYDQALKMRAEAVRDKAEYMKLFPGSDSFLLVSRQSPVYADSIRTRRELYIVGARHKLASACIE